jgi:hypothetical protein
VRIATYVFFPYRIAHETADLSIRPESLNVRRNFVGGSFRIRAKPGEFKGDTGIAVHKWDVSNTTPALRA